MKNALLLAALLGFLAGCESTEDIILEREQLKLHAEIAQRAYHAGQFDRAIQQARKALEIDADYPKALTILGYTLLQSARYTKSREARLECFEKAEAAFLRTVEVGSETDAAVFKSYFGLGLIYFMWAQEVKGMLRESAAAGPALEVEDPGEGTREGLWTE
jgi:tetratricopeptide (TPR) repeat protein